MAPRSPYPLQWPPWREVLGGSWPVDLARAELLAIAKARHRAAIAKLHPDAGGEHHVLGAEIDAAALNAALTEAESELGA